MSPYQRDPFRSQYGHALPVRTCHCKAQALVASRVCAGEIAGAREFLAMPLEFTQSGSDPVGTSDAQGCDQLALFCFRRAETVMPVTPSVQEFRRRADVAYTVLPHLRACTRPVPALRSLRRNASSTMWSTPSYFPKARRARDDRRFRI
jgi:hypothetical protein